ncbi:MAG TPA: ABC transporter ATP-binding protein [Solirubrobacteraceae bacterium]|nr:ABC transporter ATP-binding protein [Solirubrobacteraceae bacterium]
MLGVGQVTAVQIDGLTVERGGRVVLSDIEASFSAGQVTGLFGPSGSGKSTLIRSIAGVQAGVHGTIKVLGEEPGSADVRRALGYMTQAPSVYDDLTVLENVRYFAAMRGGEVGSVLERVQLVPWAHQLVRNLSGGQRARVSLAAALVGNPRVLLLDEPTVGLDPLLRRDLWRLFRELVSEGVALLVSSHVLDEGRRCDELILLREGRILAQLSPEELSRRTGTDDLDEAFIRLIERA